MGKVGKRPARQGKKGLQRLLGLRNERRKLTARLAIVDSKISELESPANGSKPKTSAEFDRWFDELTSDFPDVPPLPSNFSRGDVYDDHD